MGAAPDGKPRSRYPSIVLAAPWAKPCVAHPDRGHAEDVFVFFSNRLGCFGSLLVSAILTLLLLLLLGVL